MEERHEALNIMAGYQVILMRDLRESYELADNELESLRDSNSGFASYSVSLSNHKHDSARLWDFTLTVNIDDKGYKRIKVKYALPRYNIHKCHTKTLRRGARFSNLKNYVSTMAASRGVEYIEHYRIEELRKMVPRV